MFRLILPKSGKQTITKNPLKLYFTAVLFKGRHTLARYRETNGGSYFRIKCKNDS